MNDMIGRNPLYILLWWHGHLGNISNKRKIKIMESLENEDGDKKEIEKQKSPY
jgi:hypothetical protein